MNDSQPADARTLLVVAGVNQLIVKVKIYVSHTTNCVTILPTACDSVPVQSAFLTTVFAE